MKWFYPLLFSIGSSLAAHEGHLAEVPADMRWTSLIQWIGQFHPILLHFPIALILMAGVAELLYSLSKNKAYDAIVNFLLISAVILAVPTALAGWAFSLGAVYDGARDTLIDLHIFFAVTTLLLGIVTLWLRFDGRKRGFYLLALCLLILCVSMAAFFGGELTFGPFKWLPTP